MPQQFQIDTKRDDLEIPIEPAVLALSGEMAGKPAIAGWK
jgi:hypothetical protein